MFLYLRKNIPMGVCSSHLPVFFDFKNKKSTGINCMSLT